MYILQISDLHISTTSDFELIKNKINNLSTALKEKLQPEQKIVCCLLGDIVNLGEEKAYIVAEKVTRHLFTELQNIFNPENIQFEIIPGNHDLCGIEGQKSLNVFSAFASKVLGKQIEYNNSNTIYESNHFGYQFIGINSVLQGEYRFGQLDFESFKRINNYSNTIFYTHHSLISADAEDSAAIRNGYELQKLLEEKNAIALLHGHTHGCKRYTVGQDCQVIGVGPFFKGVSDISNQCNLIQVIGNSVITIDTLVYQGDRKTWDWINTYKKDNYSFYYGNSVSNVYKRVLSDASESIPLSNLHIQIHQKFDDFQTEITSEFESYQKAAEEWQSKIPCSELEYTHGQFMDSDTTKWEDFVYHTLSNNPTSKRAIVPLITKEMSYKGGDGKLVSFDVVQFGFENDTCTNLQITVYFRALEIKHFLPINLYESYLMAQKIKEKIRSITDVTICFHAFCAEIKNDFSCYRCAKIDLVNESYLCSLLCKENYNELINLLTEKAKMGDTIIDSNWCNMLSQAIYYCYSGKNKEVILSQIETLKTALLALKTNREHCSNYASTQIYEDKVTTEIYALSNLFEDD